MAVEGQGVVQKIRLELDRATADRLQRELQDALDKGTDPKKVEQNVNRSKSALDGLMASAKRLLGALAAAFAIRKIIEFGRESVRAALESQRAWAMLSGALKNVGVDFDSVRGRIGQIAEELGKLGVDNEDVARTLTTLVQITGDYDLALRALSPTLNMAAARQMGTEQAAVLVGRAISGNSSILNRFGIEVKAGSDVLATLNERFKDGLASQGASVIATQRLSNAWGDFKEDLGAALIQAGGGASVLDTLVVAIRNMSRWVKENNEGIQALGKGMAWTAKIGVSVLAGAFGTLALAGSAVSRTLLGIAKLNEALGIGPPDLPQKIKQLEEFTKSADDAARAAFGLANSLIGGKPGAVRTTVGPVIPSTLPQATGGVGESKKGKEVNADRELSQRIALLEKGTKVERTKAESLAELLKIEQQLQGQLANSNVALEDRITIEENLAAVHEALGRKVAKATEDMGGGALNVFGKLIGSGGLLSGMLNQVLDDVFSLNAGFNLFSKNAPGALLGMLSKYAAGKVLENIAAAIEAKAKGTAYASSIWLFGLAPGQFAAAKMHLVAAAKWAALGAAAGAGAAGLSGGGEGGGAAGSAAPRGPENVGQGATDQFAPRGGEVHIHVHAFDRDNPMHQDELQEAIMQAGERWGQSVTVTRER